MKKALDIGFYLLVALGLGCAVTDYELITDNDQVSNGQGSGIVNTNGKAVIMKTQVATIWPDGTDELFSMVDQKANGDRTITTYNNFSTAGFPEFRDDLYCNPDWQGCAIFTAPDPEEGDVDIFDGTLNEHCFGARSLLSLIGQFRYYGECGRAKLPIRDRIALANMAQLGEYGGEEALLYRASRDNLTVRFDNNAGVQQIIPIKGSHSITVLDRRRMVLDATNPLLGYTLNAAADFLESYGDRHTTVTIMYNGISTSFETRMFADRLRDKARGL